MGACALQVGHQDAWIATKIGLPAFCASSKALASKDGAVSAKAGETKMAVAIREAFRIERRDNMETLLLLAVPVVTFLKLRVTWSRICVRSRIPSGRRPNYR